MTARTRSLVRWSLGIGVLLLLVVSLDTREVFAYLATANFPLAASGIGGLAAIHLLGAATWRTLLRRLGGIVLPWPRALAAYYASQAVGGVTPANLGGDVYRFQALRAAGHGAEVSLWPILVQRSTSYLAISLLAAAALGVLWSAAQPALGFVLPALGASLLVVLVAALLVAARWSPGRALRGPRVAGSVLIGLVLGLAFHAGSIFLTYLLVLAVAPGALSLPVIAAIAVARLALAVPLTPSGLGVQEGLLSLLFAGLGMAPAAALAAMLLSRCALLVTGVAGTAVLVAGHPPRRAPGPRSDLTRTV